MDIPIICMEISIIRIGLRMDHKSGN